MLNRFSILYLAVFMVMCSSLLSCKKEETHAMDFTIDGVHDVALEENGLSVLDIHLEPTTATSEQVSLSVEGVPQGLNLTFNRITINHSIGNRVLPVKNEHVFICGVCQKVNRTKYGTCSVSAECSAMIKS